MNTTTEQSSGTVLSLGIEALIHEATLQTALRDLGDPSYREGLEVLVESLETEAKLSQIGRYASSGMIVENLVARLQIIDYRKQHPS